MAKVVDDNGYWSIKHNPISAVGVFDYLGSNISDDCEPNRIYKVYRPAETLRESVDTWNNPPKPLILQHEMLGDGFTSTDDRPVQGIISNVEFDENTGKLYGDIAVYSDEMKDAIESGVRELSLGYMCQYKKQPGVYNGQTYDYIQTDMRGNHCAIVEAGRCGSDVRVFDHKCAMDSIDVNPTDFMACENVLNKNENSEKINIDNETKGENEMADKREAIREIMAIAAKPDSDFEGGESEKIETIAKLLENSEYAKSEAGTDEDDVVEEEKKATDKCGKDSKIRRGRRARDEDDSEKKESEDEDDDEEKKAEDEDVSLSDVLAAIKELGDLIKSSKTTDEDDTDEEKKESEDEDDTDEDDDAKPTGDSRLHVFNKKNAVDADAALKAYLA